MTTQTQANTGTIYAIPPQTRLGHVHYTVANLDREIGFYENALGFKLHWRDGGKAGLGAGAEDLLRLTEIPGARRLRGTTGAYHFAVLYPNRKELARAIARLFALRYPNYPTDHVISKTTYLDDLEGNNIELYVRSLDDGTYTVVNGNLSIRRSDGSLSDGREPLDVEALFRELTPTDRLDEPLPPGTQIGHIHLYAASLQESMHFYRDVLGFEEGPLVPSFRMGEVGLSADQPHVIAFNTWQGEGAPPAPPDSLGIRYYTIVLPDASALQTTIARVEQAGITTEPSEHGVLVRDPSQISVVLTDRLD